MAQKNVRYPVARTGSTLARRTTVGVSLAVVLVLAVQALVDEVGVEVGATGAMSPFAAGPLVAAIVAAGIGAAVVYAVAVKRTARPVRTFALIAAGVFVLMLAPVFLAPPEGITATGQAVLVLYHVLVAVPLVTFVTGAVEL